MHSSPGWHHCILEHWVSFMSVGWTANPDFKGGVLNGQVPQPVIWDDITLRIMFNFYERSLHIIPLGSEPSEKRPVGLWKFSLWERIFVLRTKSSAIFASGEVLRHRLWTLSLGLFSIQSLWFLWLVFSFSFSSLDFVPWFIIYISNPRPSWHRPIHHLSNNIYTCDLFRDSQRAMIWAWWRNYVSTSRVGIVEAQWPVAYKLKFERMNMFHLCQYNSGKWWRVAWG